MAAINLIINENKLSYEIEHGHYYIALLPHTEHMKDIKYFKNWMESKAGKDTD